MTKDPRFTGQKGQTQPYPQQLPPQYAPQPYEQPPHLQQYAQPYPQQPYAQQPYEAPPYTQQHHAQLQPGQPQTYEPVGYTQQYAQPEVARGSAPAVTERSIPHADATRGVSARVRFIRLTYLHLLFAILAFAGLEYLLQTNAFLAAKISMPFTTFAIGGSWNWGIVLAAFMAVSFVADYWADHSSSRAMQYIGLALYVVAEAVIFVPLLAIVNWKTQAILARGGVEPHILRDSGITTLAIFLGLTASVFISRKDFSFLRGGLCMASSAALALIFLSLSFGFNLGLVFSVGMVFLAGGYILFQTSRILAHHDPRHHVSAALALFSSVALMLWYVIRIFLRARN